MSAGGGHLFASGGHLFASGGYLSASRGHLSASGGQSRTFVRERRTLSSDRPFDIIFWRTKNLADMSAIILADNCPPPADFCPRRTIVRQLSANIFKIFADKAGILADFLADCPRVDGGPDRIRSDPPRTLADFLSPHKVRQSPPESAKKRSSADTGADSGGQWRTQADPIGSAADSGGQLSANIKPKINK